MGQSDKAYKGEEGVDRDEGDKGYTKGAREVMGTKGDFFLHFCPSTCALKKHLLGIEFF